MSAAIGFALVSLLFAGVNDVVFKCYARFREHRVRITRKKLGYSALSGVLVFVIVNSLALALERGQASIVVPIANLSFIVALALSVAMKMERLTMRKTIATVCAAVSIYLLAQLS